MESAVNFMSTAVSITLRIEVTHCVTVLSIGRPSEVRHADEVCTKESVTAFTAITLTSCRSRVLLSALSDEKMRFTAKGANMKRSIAAGADIAKVMSSDLYAFAFAPSISPDSASGEICGTLAAASP